MKLNEEFKEKDELNDLANIIIDEFVLNSKENFKNIIFNKKKYEEIREKVTLASIIIPNKEIINNYKIIDKFLNNVNYFNDIVITIRFMNSVNQIKGNYFKNILNRFIYIDYNLHNFIDSLSIYNNIFNDEILKKGFNKFIKNMLMSKLEEAFNDYKGIYNENNLKIGDKYFNGMLKLSKVPNWNPLYEFLKHIFNDRYEDAADGFMFMGAYKYEEIDTNFYIYKHGITRKSFVLNEEGEPYELDYKLIKYYDPNKKSGHSIDNFIQSASKMSYSDIFNYIYQDIVKMVNQACEQNDCKIPDDAFLMKYADYVILREKLLKKLGIKSLSVSNTDDFKNLKIESNKTRDRLYEMFDRVCGVRLNESNDSKIDFGLLVKGYISGAMDLISSLVKDDDTKKQGKGFDDKNGDYATADDDSDVMDTDNEFSIEIALDNARTLVNDFNRVGLDRFMSEYVDEDSLINIYKDIKLIFDNIYKKYNLADALGRKIDFKVEDIDNIIKEKHNLMKLGELIFFSRNGDTKDSVKFGILVLINEIIDNLNIEPVDFSVSRGKLIFFENGNGNLV